MDTLIIYPGGPHKPGITFEIANGFVGRVVSAIADNNIPDAERVCEILNKYFDNYEPPDPLGWEGGFAENH